MHLFVSEALSSSWSGLYEIQPCPYEQADVFFAVSCITQSVDVAWHTKAVEG